jgi:hypothetical protein
MNWFQEKLFYSATIALSSGVLWLGTILTTGDVRWLYATGAASLMTSGFVGLALRKDADNIRILISRTGIGIVGGVFGTKLLLHQFSTLDSIRVRSETDLILLSGIATLVAAASHIFGYAIIKSADDSAQNVASRIVEKLLVLARIKPPKE